MLVTGCQSGKDLSQQTVVSYKVAVVLPMNDIQSELWHRMADQMAEKLGYAQESLSTRLELDLEWYDENAADLAQTAADLAQREDIQAVIGASSSDNTQVLAQALSRTKKTLITPASTSTELARIYAGKKFYWALSETDVTQCELLLHEAQSTFMAKEVSLLAPNSVYGQSFIDWFGFLAQEIGMPVRGIYTYENDDNESLEQAAAQAFGESEGMVVCVPSGTECVQKTNRIRRQIIGQRLGKDLTAAEAYLQLPYVLFSDNAYSPELLALPEDEREFLTGIAIACDPESGFEIDYRIRYGEDVKGDEAPFHDALLLTALGLKQLYSGKFLSLNDAIIDIVRNSDDEGRALPKKICVSEQDIRQVFEGLDDGSARYDVSGASSNLDFDTEQYTNVLHSIYKEWLLYQGRFITVASLSSDGSSRTQSSLASWNLRTTYDQDFASNVSFSYPARNDSWALLVATSEGWSNYRHQADILQVYQMLRRQGYPDNHIVLIMADDLADDYHNPNPGTLVGVDGEDLYANATIDYHLADVGPADIIEILMGRQSERLPEVIQSDSLDNILVFWSGHGRQGDLCWQENIPEESFNRQRMKQLLQQMQAAGNYRKMLWLVETCYSASVAEVCQADSVPGVMMITAANANETSKAYVYDATYNTWMTNRFTQNLLTTLQENANCSYIDLYRGLTRQTTGSHVTVLNNHCFDNLYLSTIGEFFHY